jgi:cell division transport system ATP-binding protein
LVSFSAVAKRYPGGKSALEGVSFALEAGEMAFLTGRSGAGKSTLLKLIPAISGATSASFSRIRSCSTTAASTRT